MAAKSRKKPTDKQFLREFTKMATKDLAKFLPEERLARLRSAERRLSKICGASSTSSHTAESRQSSLVARSRHEER